MLRRTETETGTPAAHGLEERFGGQQLREMNLSDDLEGETDEEKGNDWFCHRSPRGRMTC